MGQIKLTLTIVTIALFSLAIIGFAISFANDTGASVNIANDPELSSYYSKTGNNLTTFSEDSEGTYKSLIETTISADSGTVQSTAPFSVSISNLIGVGKNTLEVGYEKIFGKDSEFGIFFTALIGIIGFMMALYLYKTLRGLPD